MSDLPAGGGQDLGDGYTYIYGDICTNILTKGFMFDKLWLPEWFPKWYLVLFYPTPVFVAEQNPKDNQVQLNMLICPALPG